MFDPLEPRRLFAVSLGFDGVLSVTGDLNKLGHPKSDRIVVLQDGFDVTVVQNGETFGPYDASEILDIEVDAGGGADKVLARNADGSDPVQIPMILIGGSGNDTMEGGDNGDTVAGGSGKDFLAGGLGGDSIAGGPGDDRLNGSTFAVLDFDPFTDDAGDILDGGSGRDIADYSTRLDSVFVSNDNFADDGAIGSDFFTGQPATKEFDNVLPNCEDLYGGQGNDVLAGPGAEDFGTATGSSNSYIDGGPGNDLLFGELGNDTIYGNKGDDTLCGGTGADSLDGGTGNDSLLGDYRFIRATGNNPDFAPLFDFFPGPFSGDTLNGGKGDDFIRGGGDTYFATQSGNDVINGGEGNDSLFGDDGNDSIVGENGEDIIEGDVGDDTMLGGASDDVILNNSFDFNVSDADFVDGGDGFDIAQGDAQDSQPTPATVEFLLDVDTSLSQPSGAPINSQSVQALQSAATVLSKPKIIEIDGTSKADAISITQVGALVSVSVNGVVTNYAAANVRRFIIEGGKGNDTIALQTSKGKNVCNVPVSIIGAGGNDTLTGGSNNDTIYGGDGDDSLVGGAGLDQIFGDLGNDYIYGGTGDDFLNGGDVNIATHDGADTLLGGPGNDQADYRARTDNLTVTMNDNKANDGAPSEKDEVGADMEDFFAGSGNDNITGNAAANLLVGNKGNDTLIALAGSDKLIPALGKDYVDGGAGLDLYSLTDGTRDDVNEAFSDLLFGAAQDRFNGDVQLDYSLVSKRSLGRSS